MTPQETYKTLENDCFNPLTVDPNPLHDNYRFSLILRLENTCGISVENAYFDPLQPICSPSSSRSKTNKRTLTLVDAVRMLIVP